MDQERFDRIRLARSEGIGPAGYRQALRRFGSAGGALRALPDLVRRGSSRPLVPADERLIAREVERAAVLDACWLILGDGDYPTLLGEITDAPPVLLIRGDKGLLRRPSIAMVGARNASAAACRIARGLARDLAMAGHGVVSGLARGVDTAAHQGALGAGDGGTIAVIASGIDIAYPPENAALQERIAQEGLLIAEQPMGAEPRARNFPYRNRIIAGLSAATLVVEAAPKSGSLITARLAGDYGREVLAVPGSPLDPRSHGCNELIRNGATLIQSAGDVIEAIAPFTLAEPSLPWEERPKSRPRPAPSPAPVEAARPVMKGDLLTLLGPVAVSVDELIRQSGLDAPAVQLTLLELELAGRLDRHPGGRVALRPAS